MSVALAPIDQRLQAELVVMYKDTPDGRARLWPSGAMAHFKGAASTGLDMRGCVLDLNTLGIFYHAGFKTIATLAFALHVLNPHNAHALSQANFCADFPRAHVEKICQVASRLAKIVNLRNWGNPPNSAEVGSLQPNNRASVGKLLVFFNKHPSRVPRARRSASHHDGKGTSGNTRAGLSASATGTGTGSLILSAVRGSAAAMELPHLSLWSMDVQQHGQRAPLAVPELELLQLLPGRLAALGGSALLG